MTPGKLVAQRWRAKVPITCSQLMHARLAPLNTPLLLLLLRMFLIREFAPLLTAPIGDCPLFFYSTRGLCQRCLVRRMAMTQRTQLLLPRTVDTSLKLVLWNKAPFTLSWLGRRRSCQSKA